MTGDTALLVIDMQQGLFDEGAFEPERLVKQVKTLIDHAHSSGVPVIYVQHNEDPQYGGSLVPGKPEHAIHPAIAPQPGETIIQKFNPSAFQDMNLQQVLGVGSSPCRRGCCRRSRC